MFNQIGTVDYNNMLMPEQDPHDARQDAVAWAPNLVITKGQAVGRITASNLMAAYNNANVDGTQDCRGIAMYSFRTDAQGRVFYGDTTTMSFENTPHPTAPIWLRGKFAVAKLTGFDAAAMADMAARTLPNGIIYIP